MCSEVFNEWTTKEKFILACCVSRSGDQNWVSVSRTIKLINEACGDTDNRPPEWFSQKNCAMKYNELLGTASSTKRKSRGGPAESVNIETPAEQVLRKLTFARIEELNRSIEQEREKFKKLKSDLQRIQSGKIDDQLPAIWEAIQSGHAQPLEKLIKEESIDESSRKNQEPQASSSSGFSRPQRATKETEKFKSYIEQRQKHLAKYQQSQVSTATTPSTSVSSITLSQTPTTITPSTVMSPVAVSSVANQSVKNVAGVGPSPAQVQNGLANSEASKLPSKENVASKETTVKEKAVTSKSESSQKAETKSSFLSNLLSAPTKEIKDQVNQITEILKEPIKNPHQISDESYQAYLKAQPPTSLANAPVLSKLLEVAGTAVNTSISSSPITSQATIVSTLSQDRSKTTEDASKATVTTKPTSTSIEPQLNPENESNPENDAEKKDEQKHVAKENTEVDITENSQSIDKKLTPEKLLKVRKEDIISKLSETLKKTPLKKELLKSTKSSETFDTDNESKDTDNISGISQLNSTDSDVTSAEVKSEEPINEQLEEPPTKKRILNTDNLYSQENLTVDPSPPKGKKKGKGRARSTSKKKNQSSSQGNSFTSDIGDEDFSNSSSFHDTSNNSKSEADFVDDIINRKISTPPTSSVSSPASPALSIGSNCDPEVAQQQRAWRKNIMMVWKAAASHKYANVFLHPVTDEEAPGYSSIIFKPMDLSLIKKNIETGVTTTTAEFQRDIMLMFQNALMYNRKEHDVYRMATEMRDDVMEQIQSFISTQIMVQSSSEQRDAKLLRVKQESQGQTRQGSKTGNL